MTPVGCGSGHSVFKHVLNGRNGITELRPDLIPTGCGVKVAGLVPRGDQPGCFDDSEFRAMDREIALFIKFALKAAEYALLDSQLPTATNGNSSPSSSALPSFPYARERCGVSIGNGGIGSLFEICGTHDTLKASYRKVSPYFVPKILVNMASGHVSIRHGFAGPVHSVTTACAAGSHSIGDAFNFIRLGYADLMLAGGTDASIEPLALAGFSRMKALSTPIANKPIESASRPFDLSRNGFVMGEGAGVFVLEELTSALQRKAPIIAEVCGYGLSGDAHHATSPPDDGDGAFRSMQCAINDGGISANEIGYVNCHATSTPLGDQAEISAIRRLIDSSGSQASSELHTPLFVSSTKGATGHLLGAAGAVESAFTAYSVKEGIAPPTLHLEDVDPSILQSCSSKDGRQIHHIPLVAKCIPNLKYALKNSFGFGGTNASLLFGKYNE